MSAIDRNTFGKVAVLMGGWAAEREVSLHSGNAVLEGLLDYQIDAQGVDINQHNVVDVLSQGDFDRVFNVVHGRGGEDGQLQALLEIMGIPYTGCGVMASVLAMDKLMTKKIWSCEGLPTPGFYRLQEDTDFGDVISKLGLPLIVKPSQEGSSIGMSKVSEAEQLPDAYRLAAEFDAEVFAEQWIEGQEYTVGIVDGEVLPSILLRPNAEFYDFEAKYQAEDTQYHCPSGLNDEDEHHLQALTASAFKVINGKGWGRVDFMRDVEGKFWLIEVNTVPGMTSHSLIPMAAKAQGLSFSELVVKILGAEK